MIFLLGTERKPLIAQWSLLQDTGTSTPVHFGESSQMLSNRQSPFFLSLDHVLFLQLLHLESVVSAREPSLFFAKRRLSLRIVSYLG